jgi:2-pyrone-4,6-dicarboxylate lactonase
LPEGSTDCHIHFFPADDRYPYVADRDYSPAEADAVALRALYDVLGIQRFIAIQPSVYGHDNRAQLSRAAAVGLPFRAVVVLEPGASDAEMQALHDQGARGIRYILAHPGGLDLAGLERSADQANAFGWHLEFLIKSDQLIDLAPRLLKLSCPFSCDHIAFMKPELGLAQPGFTALRTLLDTGRGWVKFSGAYRMTGQADQYGAVLPLAQALAESYGERIVWGSDWPHVGQFAAMPDTTQLLDVLADWVPDEALRRQILVANAAAFYGFDA